MRYLILSDIHSNLEAFEACMNRAKRASYDAVLCCGDIVGYGPNPVEAVEAVRALNAVTIRGNHDRVASGLDEPSQFNPHARKAVWWTRSMLPVEYREYLGTLPVGPLDVSAEAQIVHGALTHEDDYIFTESEAADNFQLAQKALTFFGHSHFPGIFFSSGADAIFPSQNGSDDPFEAPYDLERKLLINPGSVGQPRDGDARAAFAIWDSDRRRIEFFRVPYDVKRTQEKMRAADLPEYLIERLARGR